MSVSVFLLKKITNDQVAERVADIRLTWNIKYGLTIMPLVGEKEWIVR